MKYLFFDKDEIPHIIENEGQMLSYIGDGSLKGKTLLFDYETGTLDKASQFREYSRLYNKVKAEVFSPVDEPKQEQAPAKPTGVTYKKTLSDGDKYIIQSKFPGQKKNIGKSCLMTIIIFVVVIPGIITIIVNSGKDEVTETVNSDYSGNVIQEEKFSGSDQIMKHFRAWEAAIIADYDTLISSYSSASISNVLTENTLASIDSMTVSKKKILTLKKALDSLSDIENVRYKAYKDSLTNAFAQTNIDLEIINELIAKAEEGHKSILDFYKIEDSVMSDFLAIYKILLSIPQKYHFESGQIVFDKTKDQDRFNAVMKSLNEKVKKEDEWIKLKEKTGIFNILSISEILYNV